MKRLRVIRDRFRDNGGAVLHVAVALTLHAETDETMPRHLCQKSAGYTADLPREGHMLQNALMAGCITLLHNASIGSRLRLITLACCLLNSLNRGRSKTG